MSTGRVTAIPMTTDTGTTTTTTIRTRTRISIRPASRATLTNRHRLLRHRAAKSKSDGPSSIRTTVRPNATAACSRRTVSWC